MREFRDNAAGLLRTKDPILVTRRGLLAGVFFPCPEGTLPIELKREVFTIFSDAMRRQVKNRGLSEDEISEYFKSWRKTRRRR